MTAHVFTADRALMAQFQKVHKSVRKWNTGRVVKILVGKYAGRKATITDVLADIEAGEWLFCCMVHRLDNTGKYLNSDVQSRKFRPTWEFHEYD